MRIARRALALALAAGACAAVQVESAAPASAASVTTAISAGYSHTCVIRGGKAWCWGDNTYGELGNGSTISSGVPVAVNTGGVLSGLTLTQIAAGTDFTCALASTGAAYCWGQGGSGQLGNGTTATTSTVPVTVSGSLTLSSISVGGSSACGLTSAGAAYCWGAGGSGQLGNGTTTTAQDTPVTVSGSLTLSSISVGGSSACGLTSAGAAYCWGAGGSGQLGNGTTTTAQDTPVTVSGSLTLSSISVGGSSACGLTSAGAAHCWGAGGSGQLGNGTTTTAQDTPVTVSGSLNLSQISAGATTACGLTSTSAAYCWGAGGSGQLGNGTTTTAQDTPVAVTATGVLSGVTLTQVSAGGTAACALGSVASSYCWGSDSSGQDGNTDTGLNFNVPVAVAASPATTVVSGYDQSCVVRNGKGYCWGNDGSGQLGNGVGLGTYDTPQAVSGGLTLAQVAAANSFACAVTTAGNAYCWGAGGSGQLGNETILGSDSPTEVLGGHTFTQVATGTNFACGLTSAGVAYCWGANSDGQMGDGTTTTPQETPTAVTVGSPGLPTGTVLTQITGGYGYACALAATGLAYCWGADATGQLGNDSTTQSTTAVAVTVGSSGGIPTGATLTQIAATAWTASTSTGSTCALASTGLAYCWGDDTYGELGNATTSGVAGTYKQPVAVTVGSSGGIPTGATVIQITVGDNFSCALISTGIAYCWGLGTTGQLGNSGITSSDEPETVTATGVLSGVILTQISSGQLVTCTEDTIGAVYCWGGNGTEGQLGDNSETASDSDVAVQVVNLVPSAPTSVTAFPSGAAATIYWVDPTSFGTAGSASGYTATASPGGATCTTISATTCTIAGLTNGTTYTVTVVTNTTAGSSYSSTAATVTPWPPLTSIAAGSVSSCTLSGGLAYCWGDDTYGELGNNVTLPGAQQDTPVAAYTGGALSGVTLTQITSGTDFTCALSSAGTVYCWGLGTSGQLGDSANSSSAVPVAVTATSGTPLNGVTVTQITAGSASVCALSSAGAAYCWGLGTSGQLGDTANSSSDVPVAVSGSLTLADIAAGGSSACGLTTAGVAYCWGLGTSGQLGDSAITSKDMPTLVTATSGTALYQVTVTQITVGGTFACAASSAGVAYCWGDDTYGELGNNTHTSTAGTYDAPQAVYVGTSGSPGALYSKTVAQLTGGQSHACALSSAGAAYCWGDDTYGELGNNTSNGTAGTYDVPTAVYTSGALSGKTVYQVSGGLDYGCAADSAGTDYCWGLNGSGQVGNDSITQEDAAALVGPQAPTGVTGAAGNTTAAMSWTAPAYLNNGTLTSYTATASPGSESCTSSSAANCTITGLTDGITYTVTVITTASTGTSAPSSSASVDPIGLDMTTPTSLTWGATETGLNQNIVDGVSGDQQMTVGDSSGTTGWHITLTATTLTTGTYTLPNTAAMDFTGSTGSLAGTSPSTACVGSCTLPTDTTTYPVAITTAASGPGAYTIYDTSASTGVGVVTIGGSSATNPIGWWINVPASAYAGSYTTTVTLDLVSGP